MTRICVNINQTVSASDNGSSPVGNLGPNFNEISIRTQQSSHKMAAVLQMNFSIYFIQIKRAFNQMPLKLVPIGGGLIDNKSALIQVT